MLSAIPFSLVGSIWLIYLARLQLVGRRLGWGDRVGGAWPLRPAWSCSSTSTSPTKHWKSEGTDEHLQPTWREAVDHGAVQRIRPKMMTVVATFFALVPILWSTGTGADVMRRIAAPMVGGLFTSFAGELIVFPAIYFLWRGIGLERTPLFPSEEVTQERAIETGEDT